MKSSLFGAVLMIGILSSIALAQNKTGPRVPYVDRGACPFECCTYRQWDVVKPTALRRTMSDSSSIILRLRTGEKVIGMTGVVITNEPGIVQALTRTTIGKFRVNAGERVYVLTNHGEGFAKVWFKGRIFEGEPYNTNIFKLVRRTKSVWWVKIKDRRGRIGWSREPENFGNVDQCG